MCGVLVSKGRITGLGLGLRCAKHCPRDNRRQRQSCGGAAHSGCMHVATCRIHTPDSLNHTDQKHELHNPVTGQQMLTTMRQAHGK